MALRSASVASANDMRAYVGLPPSTEFGADSLFSPLNSAHNDWAAEGDDGPETGLPGGINPKGSPNGSAAGGAPKPQTGNDVP